MKRMVIISVFIVSLFYSFLWLYQERMFMVATKEEDTKKAEDIIKKSLVVSWMNPFIIYYLSALEFHNKEYLDCIINLTKLKMTYPAFQQSDFLIGESWLYLHNEPRAIAFYLSQTIKNPLFSPSYTRIKEICPALAERIK